jgi:hypothetical protein
MIIEEQVTTRIDLQKAKDKKCFSKYNWLNKDSIELTSMSDTGRPVITALNNNGEKILFFNDFTAMNTVTKKTGKWDCPELMTDETVLADVTKLPQSPVDILKKY